MRLINKYTYLFIIVVIAVFFNSCRTSRQPATVALTRMSKEERIESIQQQAIAYNTFSSSLRFTIKQQAKKSSTTANAQIRIVKDQIIQISLRVPILGIEAFRISMTPEQIIILDRQNRRYFSESVKTVAKEASFDFDFYSIQALFSNQLFIAGKSAISKDDYKKISLSEDNYFTKMNIIDNQGIHYDFKSDYTDRILQTEMYENKKEVNLNWTYGDFGLASNNRLFPMKMTMELTVPDDLITLSLSLNNVNIDTDFSIDTSIPNNYQPIEMEQIIKLIQSQ